jgi:IclR family pca regulon transcriptional regulator
MGIRHLGSSRDAGHVAGSEEGHVDEQWDAVPVTAGQASVEPLERRRAFVQSLERGLAVIRAFDGEHPQLTLSEVARRTGLTRAAARRFLLTLAELGYVRTDGRLFSLRPRVLELGYAYLSSMSLPEVARPHLEALGAAVGESCSVSVLDGEEIVYVARVSSKRIMTIAISVGTRLPAFATSMGRVLLAALPPGELEQYLRTARLEPLTPYTVTAPDQLRAVLAEVAAQGHALLDQELEEGLRSIAVPVRDRDGRVVAAMNVSASARRSSPEAIRTDLLPPLLAAAREVQVDLRRTA